MKILVVDDVGYTRLYLERAISKGGHAVTTAGSGAEALKVLKSDHVVDVVLSDLMMRDMDGVALFQNAAKLERISDDGAAEPPVFVLMTALRPGCNAQQRDVDRINLARQLGFADVLFKPIEQEPLLELLDSIALKRTGKGIDVIKPANQLRELVGRLSETNNATAAREFLNHVGADLERLRALAGTV
jgi:CheY-like chemotaxis protein